MKLDALPVQGTEWNGWLQFFDPNRNNQGGGGQQAQQGGGGGQQNFQQPQNTQQPAQKNFQQPQNTLFQLQARRLVQHEIPLLALRN